MGADGARRDPGDAGNAAMNPGWQSPLRLELIDEAGDGINNNATWLVSDDLIYRSHDGRVFVVPAGFVSDLASVPRLPFVYLAFAGFALRASVLHDWLCRLGHDRQDADNLFEEAMRLSPCIGGWRASLMAMGVRLYSDALRKKQSQPWRDDEYNYQDRT